MYMLYTLIGGGGGANIKYLFEPGANVLPC